MPQVTTQVIGVDEVKNLLDELPEALFTNTRKEISRSLFNIQSGITKPMKSGVYGLQSRTGNLARSIQTKLEGKTLETLQGSVFTNSLYAPIHELGGTVTAKKAYTKLRGGPFLNIPAAANKTPVGITRLTAGSVFAQGGYIIPIKAPKAKYAVMLNGKPMFWLVKQVTISPTLRMEKTAEDEIPTLLSNLNKLLFEGLD